MPEPRRLFGAPALAAAKLMFEQNEMFDFRLELCLSNVFCAENGDGRTRYLYDGEMIKWIFHDSFFLTSFTNLL